jgi:hypothetical protein
MKRYIPALTLVLLAACRGDPPPPQAVSRTSNPGFDIELLFKHDGCEVFRFVDGDYHYYVRCKPGDTVNVVEQHERDCGEDCTETVQDEIPTIEPGLRKLCRDCPEKAVPK